MQVTETIIEYIKKQKGEWKSQPLMQKMRNWPAKFFFSRSARLLAIDLHPSGITVMGIRREASGYFLENFVEETGGSKESDDSSEMVSETFQSTSDGTFDGSSAARLPISNMTSILARLLKESLAGNGTGSRAGNIPYTGYAGIPVVLGLSGPQAFSRSIYLEENQALGLSGDEDSMEYERRITSQIALIFDQVIPIPFEESYYDYVELKPQSILIAASPRRYVLQWIEILKTLNLKVEMVTLSSVGLARSDDFDFEELHCSENAIQDVKTMLLSVKEKLLAQDPRLKSCFGLLLCALDNRENSSHENSSHENSFSKRNINLLPWRDMLRKKKNIIFLSCWLGSVCLALMLFFGVEGWLYYMKTKVDQETACLLEKKTYFTARVREIETFKKNKGSALQCQEIIAGLTWDRIRAIQFLNVLPSLLPEGLYLYTLNSKGDKINLEGNARTHGSVALFLKNLTAYQGEFAFKEIKLMEITTDKQEAGLKFKLQFLVTPRTPGAGAYPDVEPDANSNANPDANSDANADTNPDADPDIEIQQDIKKGRKQATGNDLGQNSC